jgi:hypothetical protein
MRELTKSSLSAGLAMSLFGMQTMLNAFRRPPAGGPNPAQEALDTVTQTIVNQTGDTLRETFQVADKLQRGLVDMTFSFLTLAPLQSGGGMSTIGDMLRRTTQQMTQWMPGMGMGMGMGNGRKSGCGCPGETAASQSAWPPTAGSQAQSAGVANQGWGPMPDQP